MIAFFLPDSELALAKAAGVTPLPGSVAVCPFNVGDTMTFPSARAVAFRVVSRQYQHQAQGDEADWLIGLEVSRTPF